MTVLTYSLYMLTNFDPSLFLMSAKVFVDKIGNSLGSGKAIFEHQQGQFKIIIEHTIRNTGAFLAIFDITMGSFYLGFLCVVDLK